MVSKTGESADENRHVRQPPKVEPARSRCNPLVYVLTTHTGLDSNRITGPLAFFGVGGRQQKFPPFWVQKWRYFAFPSAHNSRNHPNYIN